MPPRRLSVTLVTTLLLAACGSEDAGDELGDQVPVRDTTVPPAERRPFTATDEAGLDPLNLSVEVPWTANRVSRAPADGAPRATVLEMETLSTDAFDRTVFTFGSDAPFPSYRVWLAEDPSELDCPEGGEPSLEAGPLLVVTLTPVYSDRGSGRTSPVRSVDQPLFQEAGVTCGSGDTLIWAARVAEGGETRVLELHDPLRLVVDLR